MSSAVTQPQVMLHLGLGSFHRAHQAVYQQALHDAGDRRWVLAGGNIRGDMPETITALEASGGAYTLETVSPALERRYQRIASIRRVIPHDVGLTGLIAQGADPATGIVSFTVTEAGYYLDSANRLDLNFADLAADVEAAKAGRPHPRTATIYGALTAILRARRAAGAGPLTLLNCDNLRHNGAKSRSGLLHFIELIGDAELLAWVQANTTSPNAMVDRITPRPTPEVRERVRAATGVDDPAALMGESFIQWVIEDRFAAGRPTWETVGVQMVDSVDAFEEAKIRLLNAPHSCIAWAGTLKGLEYIHQGTLVPDIRQMAFDYVTNDVIPCLNRPGHASPVDLPTYRDVVLDRFSNAALCDTNQRVAMDGFSKIPGFIVPTLRECLARGVGMADTALLPALFFAVLGRWHRGELPYAYQDGVMDPAVAHGFFSAPDPLAAFGHDPMLWGDLAGNETLAAALRAADLRVQAFVAEAA